MKKLYFLLLLSVYTHAQDSSTLPFIIINTEGREIVDEPKIMATMKIIDNGPDAENQLTDLPAYEGFIGIEFRGSSSQMFPKKPFGLETWDANGEDLKVPLFGWPEESDWILFASYNEKSLMHNVLTMNIAEQMGMYASRAKYVELYLNESYQGVYIFMEKIKRDKGRVDISKLTEDEESGDDLTGGYIIKIDKTTGSNEGSWFSEFPNNGPFTQQTEFLYEYPKDINTTQKGYIREFVRDFENALMSDDFTNPVNGYRKYIDVETFIDVTLLNELSKNVDAYRISTFLYKDKDSKDGRLKMGPPWDYDISYGNADYCEGWLFSGFSYDFNKVCPNDNWLVPFWWKRFLADPLFIAQMRDRYDELRSNGIFKEENLMNLIDSLASEIRVPQQRNFNQWPIIGTYVWPSPRPIAQSWQGEVDELKTWLSNRLKWLDENLPTELQVLSSTPELSFSVKAYPNPFINSLTLNIESLTDDKADLKLFDLNGKPIEHQQYPIHKGQNVINVNFENRNQHTEIELLKIKIGSQEIVQRLIRH
ncbi:CotH kinase family protein [Jiulongibacter sediminis]|uniref:CotH kinase family protein n=1 Tax=Jiulongibacter sediminis TaxID=1605367 RepID=UPI0006DCD606|nr:CotH kinase family protein [Jiulongibacter sediminis]